MTVCHLVLCIKVIRLRFRHSLGFCCGGQVADNQRDTQSNPLVFEGVTLRKALSHSHLAATARDEEAERPGSAAELSSSV